MKPRSPLPSIPIGILLAYSIFASVTNGFAAATVDFARDIRPLLNTQCTSCHGGVKRAGGISFLSREGAMQEAKSGRRAIAPGDEKNSELLRRISSTDPDERMPPADHGPGLAASDVEKLRAWIREGAKWSRHWAYEKPVRAAVPATRNQTWARTDLDKFVLARLEAEGLQASPEADRLTWLRRVTFDLIGLPPTEKDAQAFTADLTPQAYERVVDRLLGSPAYGERWASSWMDLARYADTVGYERDRNRVVWPWRDWVIRAYNADLGYDDFVTRQLAGDLLPGVTDDDRLATAFHRNTQTNTEDGTDDEEFRLQAVIDRIGTTWEGLMGTSFRCVQCHSHPYDPFPHEDFYRFAALFNTTRDHDANEDFPLLRVAEKESDRARLSTLEAHIRQLRGKLHGEGMELAGKARWTPLRLTEGKSTGQAKLNHRDAPNEGVPEVIASGTITVNSVYTVDFAFPDGGSVAALRLQVLPEDEAKAVSFPELGFVLSSLRVQILPAGADAQPIEVPLATAYDEDPEAFFRVEDSLTPGPEGWSAYPLFHRRRTAVFVPASPALVPRGATLRCILAQDVQSSGITAQAIRRARFAYSTADGWAALLQSQEPRLKDLRTEQQQADAVASVGVPVMAEQPASQLRETRVFHRGNWRDKGATVSPGVPAVLGEATVRDRLELARWITSRENPLFARVAVNRVWEQLFGAGIVESSGEFGSTGQAPSHLELLDWLAVRFGTELGFHNKRLIREIVLSATYRQDARVTAELLAKDPRNRLLARGPRQRLSAEMVRDQALAVSGLLSGKVGGPPVMPRQPEGIWRTVYNGGRWITSPGEDAYRRSVYTFIRRTSGYPSFQTFDAPSREFCTVRRLPTNTPLQALVTLNDPVYIEAASALGKRMFDGGASTEQRIAVGWRLAVGRPAAAGELEPLLALHRQAQSRFDQDAAAAAALAKSPGLAAMTVVANALLNLDCVLTR